MNPAPTVGQRWIWTVTSSRTIIEILSVNSCRIDFVVVQVLHKAYIIDEIGYHGNTFGLYLCEEFTYLPGQDKVTTK